MNNSQHNAFMKTAQMGFLKAFTGFIITGFGEKKSLSMSNSKDFPKLIY